MSETYRVALLGHGIGPSLSPAMHMREAACLDLDYEYRTIDLIDRSDVDLGRELAKLEEEGFAATNVTHPFKQAVLEHVDELSEGVRRVGAANLVLLQGGRRRAHNTDYTGFRTAVERFLGDGPRESVLQVGAGGAGAATAAALVDLGFANVVVHDRAASAVDAMVDRFSRTGSPGVVGSGGDLDAWLARVSGVVHVTPTGMREHPGIALDVDRLAPDAWVAEVVYRPLETELVARARARGLRTLDGGGMAVGQAVDSLRLITGREPDAERMHAHFDELIGAEIRGAS